MIALLIKFIFKLSLLFLAADCYGQVDGTPNGAANVAEKKYLFYIVQTGIAPIDSRRLATFVDSTKLVIGVPVYFDSLYRTSSSGNPETFVWVRNSDNRFVWSLRDSLRIKFSQLDNTPTTLSGYGITDATSNARSAISLTTTGTTGASTYNSGTGILNVPQYPGGTVTSVGLSSTDLSVSGSPVTTSGNITANLTTTGITAGTYMSATFDTKGRATAGINPTWDTISASRSFNFAYQMSSTAWTQLYMSAALSCNLSLSGGQSGEIFLEISANGSTNWITVGKITGSNTGTLTVGLNTTQLTGSQVGVLLPPTYFWRLRTNNITGTPTYTMNGGTKMTY